MAMGGLWGWLESLSLRHPRDFDNRTPWVSIALPVSSEFREKGSSNAKPCPKMGIVGQVLVPGGSFEVPVGLYNEVHPALPTDKEAMTLLQPERDRSLRPRDKALAHLKHGPPSLETLVRRCCLAINPNS